LLAHKSRAAPAPRTATSRPEWTSRPAAPLAVTWVAEGADEDSTRVTEVLVTEVGDAVAFVKWAVGPHEVVLDAG